MKHIFHVAAKLGLECYLKTLLQKNVNSNFQLDPPDSHVKGQLAGQYNSPLNMALVIRNAECVKLLLEKADTDFKISYQMVYSFHLHTILGLQESSTLTEITQAYKKLALVFHPDKNAASTCFQAILAAKLLLLDEACKRIIDFRHPFPK